MLFQNRNVMAMLILLIMAAASSAGAADDPLLRIRELEQTVAANPNNGSAVRELAHAYALALLQSNRNLAGYAANALDNSGNVWILGNAAYMLQCQYNETLQRGSPNERAAMLAERYFLRARSLDPKLDRGAILPEIDLQQIASASKARAQEQQVWTRRFEEAYKRITRLRPEAFPDLPRAIAAVVRARNCTVPQPSGADSPRNVIHGEFFESGQQSWAVLCSVAGWSTILVFRTAEDPTPHSLARMEDRNFLQNLDDRSVGYSREIQAVGREFILGHENGYQAPKPTRITHQGIDDAYLGKASTVWYLDAGVWFQFPGAD